MGQERFRIRPPAKTDDGYDHDDFARWRSEIFAAVDTARLVDFLQPLLAWGAPHRYVGYGLASVCSCGWEDRKFWSDVTARCAWWQHAEPLVDWEQIEGEYALAALAR